MEVTCQSLAEPTRTSGLIRSNSMSQYNNTGVVGINVFGNLIPIIFPINLTGTPYNAIVYTDKMYHRCFTYENEEMSRCCRQVIKFNIDHYVKCYLPGSIGTDGNITTPYTLNRCQKCDVSIQDNCGRDIGVYNYIKYYQPKTVWKASKTLQKCTNCDSNGFPKTSTNASNYATIVSENMRASSASISDSSISGKTCRRCTERN